MRKRTKDESISAKYIIFVISFWGLTAVLFAALITLMIKIDITTEIIRILGI